MNRRKLLTRASSALPLLHFGNVFGAGGYPSKPISIVVAFATGTSSDILARLLTQNLTGTLGPAIVENRPGGGGVIGTEYVAAAAPDGYTLAMGTTSTLITSPLLYENAKYRTGRDLRSVRAVARSGFAIAVANTSAAPRTLRELVARLRNGQEAYASSGVGTLVHLTALRFLKTAGAEAVMIPYAGGTQALSDVAAGHVLFSCETLGATMPLVAAGKLRVLAVTTTQRHPQLADVPTMAEGGYPGFTSSTWFAVMAPAKTRNRVIETLERAIERVANSDAMRGQLIALGLEPMDVDSNELDRLIAIETLEWEKVIKLSGVKLK